MLPTSAVDEVIEHWPTSCDCGHVDGVDGMRHGGYSLDGPTVVRLRWLGRWWCLARSIQSQRREQAKPQAGPVAVALFVGGHLASWTAFGLVAYRLLHLGRELSPGFLSWDSGGPYVAGGASNAAGPVLGGVALRA